MLLRISLILVILAGIGTIVVTQIKTREHLKGIIAEREKNAKDRDVATGRYKKAETTLTTTSNKLNQTQATLTKTEEDLNGAKQQLKAAEENIAKVRVEVKAANDAKTLAQQELEKWNLLGVRPEQIKEMTANLQKSKDSIAALEDEKKILDRRVKELQNQIELIVGTNEYVVPLPAGTKGTVVAVDPKWNFVVLDLGANKGMLEGGVLMVHRNSQLVGKVRIREVLSNRCVATLMPGWKLGEIEEGDQVFN